jgi:hypothetical protein
MKAHVFTTTRGGSGMAALRRIKTHVNDANELVKYATS